jgi:hypothetical protein
MTIDVVTFSGGLAPLNPEYRGKTLGKLRKKKTKEEVNWS